MTCLSAYMYRQIYQCTDKFPNVPTKVRKDIIGGAIAPLPPSGYANAQYVMSPGGGGALDFHVDGGGVPLGVENLTLSQTARCTRNTTLSQYTLLKISYAYPVAILHRRWCPDRGPVINIVGWEPLGSNPVINGVARQ